MCTAATGRRGVPLRRLRCATLLFLLFGIVGCQTRPRTRVGAFEPDRQLQTVLRQYYGMGREPGPSVGAVALGGCRADEGDVCFGGDPEDQLCSTVPACRTESRVSRFLDDLRTAARRSPDDPYVMGQAVYAFVRFDRPIEAFKLSDECTAGVAWCTLLQGLVLQRAGRGDAAEAAFRGALGRSALACGVTDIAALLANDERAGYEALTCEERQEADDRFWWLSDPLFIVPGNDRWTEHVARRVQLIMHSQILDAVRYPHPAPHDDAVARRGLEDSFDDEGRFVSNRAACCHFVPETPPLTGALGSLSYRIASDRDTEGFTPRYGVVRQVPAQFARFERGDTLVLVAVAEIGGAGGGPKSEVSLAWSPAPFQPLQVFRTRPAGTTVAFQEAIDRGGGVASVEFLASADGAGAGRHRVGFEPWSLGPLRASDVLLTWPTHGQGLQELHDAVAAARSAAEVIAGEPLGLYWEVYGLADENAITTTLQVEGADPGVLDRIAAALGLMDAARRSGSVSWSERPQSTPHVGTLDLDTQGLRPGTYTLRLTFTSSDGSEAETERSFLVLQPEG